MEETLDDIRASYFAELRALAPNLRAWLAARIAAEDEDTVLHRWATGLAGHPRVIDCFRRHYMRIEALNDRSAASFVAAPPPDAEAMWGVHDPGEAPQSFRHIDILVNDLERLAPDIYDLVEGMVLVPVGLDDKDAVV